MANPQIEVQRWSAAAVNWGANNGTTGISYNLNQKLRDWITVVNGNASNSNRQIEMFKDETTSTGTTIQGHVLKVYYDSTNAWYQTWFGSNTSIDAHQGESYTDNGNSEGYGRVNSGSGNYYTFEDPNFRLNGTSNYDLYVSYDTTDTQEYFYFYLRDATSSAYRGGAMVLKTNFGHWLGLTLDGSGGHSITYDTKSLEVRRIDGAGNSSEGSSNRWRNCAYVSDPSYRIVKFNMYPEKDSDTTYAAALNSGSLTTAGNPHLSSVADSQDTSFEGGAYAEITTEAGASTGHYVMAFDPYGPYILLGTDFDTDS